MALNDIRGPFICFHLLLCARSLIQNVAVASASADTIVQGKSFGLSQTITSCNQVFEFGFFSPQNSTGFHLGIWYKNIDPRTVVWVGSRLQPLTGSSPYLTLEQGNLVVVDDRITYRVSDLPSPRNTSLVLLDSGNLVLRDRDDADIILWQSFDDPTDTLLPGMKLGIDKKTGKVWSLTAWENENNPAPGSVSLRLNPQNSDTFIIRRQNQIYWSTGSWNGRIFPIPNVPEVGLYYVHNFSFISNKHMSYFTYSLNNTLTPTRCVLDGTSGQLRLLTWLEISKEWNVLWTLPRDHCDVHLFCGPFSSCRNYSRPYCQCLEGFSPSDSKSWEQGYTSSGCARKVPLQCEESRGSVLAGRKDGFKMMPQVVLPLNPNITYATSREFCRSICLRDCSCNAYAYNGSGDCLLWSGDLKNMRQLAQGDPAGTQMYLRLAAYELQNNHGEKRSVEKIIAASIVSFMLLSFSTFVYFHRKMKQKTKREEAEDILLFDVEMMGVSADVSDYPSDRTNRSAKRNYSWLPQFSFASVAAATDNFSAKNKLGEGGFGPVYKGKILDGQEVAVKRLSRQSVQGLQELRNETTLIAKLQHRNLVRILGCCLEKDEKILIYELMPNRSLDLCLFDPSKRVLLDWAARARIIEGISQGLLYLHEHSRLRIIHRDLKASNILLDKDMNPKISDFGLAKMFSGNISQAKTNRIVGTYGYMSPEYAMRGLCSTKSDVFSFGVIMLEIISGKKNTEFYRSESVNLLSFAWELWCGDGALQLVDKVLKNRYSDDRMKRYINIAFLCIHEIAAKRPAMSEVVPMLMNEDVFVPPPEQPAFSYLRLRPTRMANGPSTPSEPRSGYDETISSLEAR